MKPDEIRTMDREELEAALDEIQQELMHEEGLAAMGGAPPNPGRIGHLKRVIARIKTIQHEQRGET